MTRPIDARLAPYAPTAPNPESSDPVAAAIAPWKRRGLESMNSDTVYRMIDAAEAQLTSAPQARLRASQFRANGFVMRAAIDALQAKGLRVEFQELGFHKRIDEIRVMRR